jgi:putative glutamine amidotransferase
MEQEQRWRRPRGRLKEALANLDGVAGAGCRGSGGGARMQSSMSPAESQPKSEKRPRVGIPWRTAREETEKNCEKIANYEEAVRAAGGEPVLLSLAQPAELERVMQELDGFVLPGSPADVETAEYGEENRGLSEPADLAREQTDRAILRHAFAEKKPVLAICYGCQLLNVFLGGTLVQDLKAETGTTTVHSKKDIATGGAQERQKDPVHGAEFEAGSRLAQIAGGAESEINSSHHQAIAKPGRSLRVTAHAPDGTIEGVEWTGDTNWVMGVQWHPERMFGDAFSERLFREFVGAARVARKTAVQGT